MAVTWEASLVAVTPSSDGVTFDEICGLPFTALTCKHELSGAGQATTTVPAARVDRRAAARLIHLELYPTELWLRRTTSTSSELVHSGPVVGCQIKNYDLTLTSPGLLAYLDGWLRTTDYDGSGLDIATVVAQLIDDYQALSYGSMGFDTSALPALTGVLVDPFTITAAEPQFLSAAITALGQRDDGFDIAINPGDRTVQLWTPRRGTDLSADVILDRRSIASPDLAWSIAPDQLFSDVVATGSSASSAAMIATAENATLRATLGRRYGRRSYTNVADSTQLAAAAQRAIDNAATPAMTLAPTTLPVTGFLYGDFNVGDIIGYSYDAGLGEQTATPRLSSIEVAFTSGAETLKVGLL